ncbi:lanthionine synthetase C family protein [Herbidospora mongoliensis]|uniref:lanthionine synthetase C family protein n=1 Tax=Herbidospora mongoliensis TaxID=688067 RepID=UPI00083672A1|nr:lanthionine synthetase C family protein [Herbidospora mongoliensis]
MNRDHPVLVVAEAVADHLADPAIADSLAAGRTWWPHHLAHGAAGIVLLHSERAAAGLAPWQRAHDWLAYIARTAATSGTNSHLNYGVPALAFALATVAEQLPGAYQSTLRQLDATVAEDAHNRAADHDRQLAAGHRPLLADFDVVRGVTGLGAYLLYRTPDSPALAAVLSYLVRLTEPATHAGRTVPGWWTPVGPHGDLDQQFPDGHANVGVAHGIGGPLALLALAVRAGITVPGHTEAITAICTWLDHWRADTATGPAWPYWVTRDQHDGGAPASHEHPQRPSWCYGTAGLARAQQLAAIVLGDVDRQRAAERALVLALNDPAQRAATVDASLCHGFGGMAHLATQMAADADLETAAQLRAAAEAMLDAVHPPDTDPEITTAALLHPEGRGPGLLEGAAGVALAVQAPAAAMLPQTGWDACLLIR